MSRILVLGGYGGFGARVSAALAGDDHHVVVAGRSLDKARSFCADKPGLFPAVVDRDAVAAALALHRPDLLVDATGPFQSMTYDVPAACIAARVHYLDIADARAFVCGIGALDAQAKAAGIVVLSGGSSVPALSGAAVRALAVDRSASPPSIWRSARPTGPPPGPRSPPRSLRRSGSRYGFGVADAGRRSTDGRTRAP